VDFEKRLADARKAIQKNPEDAEALRTLGPMCLDALKRAQAGR